ncbi:High affinity nitrate transporter 2.5 [Linum grandiflorum]
MEMEAIDSSRPTMDHQNQNPSPKFAIPVDSEHKSTKFPFYSFAAPHMLAFHLSWLSFFSCFVSTFAAPPLLPIIRDDLNLTATDIGNAGIASVAGAVLARLAMGTACDLFGPRLASASLILLCSPAVFCTAMASSPLSFLLLRFFTGFSLSTFVSTQFWMSSMFSSSTVTATANSVAAGWGNLGGGAAQLLMPFVFNLIHRWMTKSTAWRISFFVPAIFQTVTAFAVLIFGQDSPDGDFQRLEKTGDKPKDSTFNVLYHGITNYRGWILGLTYGFCFGVELTIDNIIAEYFHDQFNLELKTAGIIAGSFGFMNLVSRPAGGMLSDKISDEFGMKGRLWTLWSVQTFGGIVCIILGRVRSSISASIAVMLCFSFLCQAACGLTFGIVPFVSRRSLGVISGMTGGGGNVGAVLTQLMFFRGERYSKEMGIMLMGITIVSCSLPIGFIYFPQWGAMFCRPAEDSTEEDYYMGEWSSQEKQRGMHCASVKFAGNCRRERGRRFRTWDDSMANANPALFV